MDDLNAAYVNASFVRAPKYSPTTGAAVTGDYEQPPAYIATQGPLESTLADFLTMLYEQRVPLVVMLCR